MARDLGPLRGARDQGEPLQARQVLHQSSRKAASPGYSGLGEASEKLLAEVVLKFLGLYRTIALGLEGETCIRCRVTTLRSLVPGEASVKDSGEGLKSKGRIVKGRFYLRKH